MCFDHDNGHFQWSTTAYKHIAVAFLGQNNSYAIELALNPLADSEAAAAAALFPGAAADVQRLGGRWCPGRVHQRLRGLLGCALHGPSTRAGPCA